MITIIDYGMGNLGSVMNMLKRLNIRATVTSNPSDVEKAEKIILPGVGPFDPAMQRLNDSGLRKILDKKALEEKIPVLGICLGMQLLTKSSEEGVLEGLGWLNAKTMKFNFSNGNLKIPHMGWNLVEPVKESLLIKDLPSESRFYFVHSYFVNCSNTDDVVTTTTYGRPFHSIVQHNNIFGAQFHPEKSHKFGMKLLENFAAV